MASTVVRSASTALESAVKGGKGGDVIALYKQVGDALDSVEKFDAVAKQYAKVCKKEAPALVAVAQTKKCGEWLLKSGPAAVEYGQAMPRMLRKRRSMFSRSAFSAGASFLAAS